MRRKKYLAMDYGASSGRGILGHFDGKRITLQEVHRFRNYFVDQNGTFYWDVFRLFYEMLIAIEKAGRLNPDLQSVGIDSWGTDFGLLDSNGQLLGNVRCMRNADGSVVEQCKKKVSLKELYKRTGIQTIFGNTIFQLYERTLISDPALKNAERMLMLPDLLAYFLTGDRHNEYTIATTSMLYNVNTRFWDLEVAEKLDIPRKIFGEIIMPGQNCFHVRSSLLVDTGIMSLKYVPVGTHDTASAVAAIPLQEDIAFCSSGTWSILGIELENAIISERAFIENFSNEGTVDGKIRLLKNIMGMWVLQQCIMQWRKQGLNLNWDQIVYEASNAKPFVSFINLEEPEFYRSGNMVARIQKFCQRTNQTVPKTVAEISRCVYESLAMQYRYTIEQLERITGKQVKHLHIVGGGCNNKMLNQFAANAIGRLVYSGPVESASIGNILMQAYAFNELNTLAELRQVVKDSFELDVYEPMDVTCWKGAYQKYMDYCCS